MFVPNGTRSSQYAARNGWVWVEVGRQEFVGSAEPEVLEPNSIQPLVDRTRVVNGVPSIVNVNGSVTPAVLSSPVSVVKPLMSSGLKATIAPKSDPTKAEPVVLQNASADFSQDSWHVSAAIDGREDSGWAVSPQFGKNHEATFETKTDIGGEGGSVLTITISQQYPDGKHALGKFRLFVTGGARPLTKSKLPELVAAALAVPKDQRTPDQAATLTSHYKSLDAEHARLASEVQKAAEQAKSARAVGVQDLAWALINNPAFLFNR